MIDIWGRDALMVFGTSRLVHEKPMAYPEHGNREIYSKA